MQFPKGQIIAFEGLDSSFKETNYKRFIDYLKSTFPKESERGLLTASFPRYGSQSCTMVERFLKNIIDSSRIREGGYSDAICSLYSIDRLDYWNTLFKIPYNNIQLTNLDLLDLPTSCFIFDRYNFSNAIYNPENGKEITKRDILKEKEKFGNPLPTILVWFRMNDRDTYLDILNEKSDKDFNESNKQFMADVWDRTDKFFKSNILESCGITSVIVDCLDAKQNIRTRDDIFNDVISGIEEAIRSIKCKHEYMPDMPDLLVD